MSERSDESRKILQVDSLSSSIAPGGRDHWTEEKGCGPATWLANWCGLVAHGGCFSQGVLPGGVFPGSFSLLPLLCRGGCIIPLLCDKGRL